MMRKEVYFKKRVTEEHDSVSMTPPALYRQEADWTCAIACVRTILSGVTEEIPAEDAIAGRYQLVPGPQYSKDIKKWDFLNEFDVKYGCDYDSMEFDRIIRMMKDGYFVMLESMVNYAHWMVLLGYYTLQSTEDIEKYQLLFYDPYYDRIRLMNADEFINMWFDGDHGKSGVVNDFVAIKKK